MRKKIFLRKFLKIRKTTSHEGWNDNLDYIRNIPVSEAQEIEEEWEGDKGLVLTVHREPKPEEKDTETEKIVTVTH